MGKVDLALATERKREKIGTCTHTCLSTLALVV